MLKYWISLCVFSLACVPLLVAQTTNPSVKFRTNMGDINVELYSDVAPKNVNNFLGYVDRGDYANTFFHRSVPGFVIQGGGYYFTSSGAVAVAKQPPVVNEFHVSNARGTIAMAKLGGDPDSATSEWFFNLADNSANLDSQNGGFTVFGRIADSQGQAVVDAIAALQIVNAKTPFDQLPVINYTAGSTVMGSNLVTLYSVSRNPAFFKGETALSNGVYFLTFPNGTPFGYYSYLSDANYIFHFDLGYEYVFDAADGRDGVYLYDFASDTFFYTSPVFPFPYLYDFSLKAVLYYYADLSSAGHYTTNPRFFYNTSTGEIFTK